MAEIRHFTVSGESFSILNVLSDNWEAICKAFKFDRNGRTLMSIQNKKHNNKDRCQEMFSIWLKTANASWQSLILVLQECGENLVVDKVMKYVQTGEIQKL